MKTRYEIGVNNVEGLQIQRSEKKLRTIKIKKIKNKLSFSVISNFKSYKFYSFILMLFCIFITSCNNLPEDLQNRKDACNDKYKELLEQEKNADGSSDYKQLITDYTNLKNDVISYTAECNKRGISKENHNLINEIDQKLSAMGAIYEEFEAKKIISCQVCNKQIIGSGYDPELLGVGGQSYFCSLNCAKVDDKNSTEEYNKILRKYGKEEIKPQLSDEKVNDENVCTMCKGTGIEKNTAQYILGGEDGRVCSMCNGKGRQEY